MPDQTPADPYGPLEAYLRRLRDELVYLASGGGDVDAVLSETTEVVALKRGCR